MKAVIVSGGSIDKDLLKVYLKKETNISIIGVDGGCDLIKSLGLQATFVIGDFDTYSLDSDDVWLRDTKILKLNPDKDETDTHAAILQLLKEGYKTIDIFGFSGSRIDHLFGILLASIGIINDHDVDIHFLDTHNYISCMKKDRIGYFNKNVPYYSKPLKYLSVIPTELTTFHWSKGLKYNLSNRSLSPYISMGVSNEIEKDDAEISIQDGFALVIQSRD